MQIKNRSSINKELTASTQLSVQETLRYSKRVTLLIMGIELVMILFWFIAQSSSSIAPLNIHYLYGYLSLFILSSLAALLFFLLGKEPAAFYRQIITTQTIFAISFILWSIYFTCFDVIYRDAFSAMTYVTVITIIPIFTNFTPKHWVVIHVFYDLIMLYMSYMSNVALVTFWTDFVIYAIISIIVGCTYYEARTRSYHKQIELQKVNEQQRNIAYTDDLTGIPNRRAYTERIDSLGTGQMPDDFAVVVVDINGLKQVNDTLGHLAGDEIIIATAECLSDAFGQNNAPFRIGGDEFVLLIDLPEEQLQSALSKFHDEVSKWHGFHCPTFTVACGYASRRDHRISTLKELTILADEEMYKDKVSFYQTNTATSSRS